MAPPHSRVPSPLPLRLVVAKRQEQAPTPAPSASSTAPPVANSSASRFLPSQTSLSSSDDNNGGDGGKPEVWRYAIVVIIAVLGLFLLVRLAFVYRLRKHHRQLYLARQQELADHRNRRRSRDPRSGANWSRNNSVDTFDLGTPVVGGGGTGRGAGEAPPPAYEEAALSAAGVAVGEEAPHSSRPSLFSRLFSSRPSATPAPPSSYDLRVFPPSSSPSTGSTSPNPTSRSSTRPHSTSFAEAEAVRRALADAGLLVIPPSLALRHSALNPSSALASSTAEADEDTLRRRREREERRERRRQRRRDRREREREEQEGMGLPTYSKRKAEGEEVLQRGEGWKDSDEDTDSGSEDEGAPVVEAGGAVVPALTGAPAAREVDEDAQAQASRAGPARNGDGA